MGWREVVRLTLLVLAILVAAGGLGAIVVAIMIPPPGDGVLDAAASGIVAAFLGMMFFLGVLGAGVLLMIRMVIKPSRPRITHAVQGALSPRP